MVGRFRTMQMCGYQRIRRASTDNVKSANMKVNAVYRRPACSTQHNNGGRHRRTADVVPEWLRWGEGSCGTFKILLVFQTLRELGLRKQIRRQRASGPWIGLMSDSVAIRQ